MTSSLRATVESVFPQEPGTRLYNKLECTLYNTSCCQAVTKDGKHCTVPAVRERLYFCYSTSLGTCKQLEFVVLRCWVVGSHSNSTELQQHSVQSGPSPTKHAEYLKTELLFSLATGCIDCKHMCICPTLRIGNAYSICCMAYMAAPSGLHPLGLVLYRPYSTDCHAVFITSSVMK